MSEQRSIETIEQELANVEAAQAAIVKELADIDADLSVAEGEEAQATVEAIRAGKPAKASAKVKKLRERRDELGRQRAVAEPERLKLLAERAGRLLERAEADQAEKGATVAGARKEVAAAQERLDSALTEASFARDNVLNLREQRNSYRRSLALMGHADHEELAERERNRLEAEKYREQVREMERNARRDAFADAGIAPLEAVSEKVRTGESRIMVGGIRMPGSDDPQ